MLIIKDNPIMHDTHIVSIHLIKLGNENFVKIYPNFKINRTISKDPIEIFDMITILTFEKKIEKTFFH